MIPNVESPVAYIIQRFCRHLWLRLLSPPVVPTRRWAGCRGRRGRCQLVSCLSHLVRLTLGAVVLSKKSRAGMCLLDETAPEMTLARGSPTLGLTFAVGSLVGQ